jgi:serine/threonine protein kinase
MVDDLTRGMWLGRHELLMPIGRGGMATVWVARRRTERRQDDRIVAIKAILADLAQEEEFVNMFLDEGRLVQSIRHPNVVELYEVGQEAGLMYMAMEWVEGDSLHTLIAEAGKRRPIPPEMAVRIVADAAAGLHAAHELRNERGELLEVVHRDVSPHNILIGSNGAVKLVDFGVAKAVERLAEATVAGQVKGKFGYMSPEQAVARPVDRRSDVFSLGIVLFETTTGRRLFRGSNDAETLHLVVEGDIPKPSSIDRQYPRTLEQIVLKALSRSRRERFQTAAELQWALEGFLKQERTVVTPAGVASLLKKVLGNRIETRRQAVRAVIKEMEPTASRQAQLVPAGTAFAPTIQDKEHYSASGRSGVSDRGVVGGPGSGPTPPGGRHDIGQLTGSFVGLGPEVGKQAGRIQVELLEQPRRSVLALVGYLVGIVGLLAAGASIGLYLVRPRTRIITVPAPSSSELPLTPRATQLAAQPQPTASGSSSPEAGAASAPRLRPGSTGER